jgi:hypothetical protein
MRKRLIQYLLCMVLAIYGNISFAQTDATFGDTASLESVLNSDSVINDDENYNEDEEVDALVEEVTLKIDISNHRTIDYVRWQEYKNDKAFNYKIEKPKPTKKPNLAFLKWIGKLLSSGILKFILYSLVAIAILYILYTILIQSEFNYFKKRKKKKDDETESWENVEAFTDWDRALQNALDIPDYRLAVRVMYLETLQTLHLAQLIKYEQEKTNWQYVAELGDTTFKKPFTLFTKYFDYVWYGNFEMTKEKFEEIKNIYTQLKQSVKI